jgi:hypothetical protein
MATDAKGVSRTARGLSQRGRSVSRVLCRSTPKRRPTMAIHLRPSVARRLMRPTRGLGSAPLPRPVARHGLRPPIWPCSGWSLPVSLRPRPESRASASSLWHWSSSHDGRVLPATLRCGARTFLTALRGSPRPVPRDHPTASLTSGYYPWQSEPASDATGSARVVSLSSMGAPPAALRSSMRPTSGAYDLCSS